MSFFEHHSIRRKLTRIIMFTSTVTLIFACLAFAVYDTIMFNKGEEEEALSLAEIVGINSTAALMFNDVKSGKENLEALRSKSHIVMAALYTQDGKVFATYKQGQGLNLPIPEKPGLEKFVSEGGYFKLFRPIVLDRARVGTIFIQSDKEEVYSHFELYAVIVAIVLAIALYVSFLLSSKLQAMISDPIVRLTETANQVAMGKDYSMRAVKEGAENELGVLVERFNEMLSHIQERDEALHKINEELDDRVKERTKDLEREIEERKKIEEKLKHIMVELQRSNQELTDFASIASHDLKEPLRKVMTFSERLKTKCDAMFDDQARDYLARMQNALSRMQGLIDSLLKLSRVATKAQPFLPVDFNRVAEEVLNDLEILVKNSGGSVIVEGLPTLNADAFQIRQLFQNLIANALKFKKEGVAPEVSLKARPIDEKTWEIRVADNGIGFEQKFIDRIFKPFERLHGRSQYEGSGVGLAICQKIVQRHGGAITAESEPDKGATFIIVLPQNS